MKYPRVKRPIGGWNGKTIPPGGAVDLKLSISESYSGMTIRIPVHVRRGPDDGPVVFVTAAMHGNEINGTGAIRHLILDETLKLQRGALILVPVVNLLGFDRHSRYLPDRRDLNRCFPGSETGSLAGRMARILFDEIVARSDYGIDLHTAAVRRTNFPNVRGDMSRAEVRKLAESFGSEIILDSHGPRGCLRREACKAGCPTIILEAGEVWKVEPAIVEYSLRGIRNVLCHLGMIDEQPVPGEYQVVITRTKWVRADHGGFLQFHVRPGEIVQENQVVATNTSLLGRERNVLTAPFDGVILGMTTIPAVSPGEPVCHIGQIPRGVAKLGKLRKRLPDDSLHERVIGDLATNLHVVPAADDS